MVGSPFVCQPGMLVGILRGLAIGAVDGFRGLAHVLAQMLTAVAGVICHGFHFLWGRFLAHLCFFHSYVPFIVETVNTFARSSVAGTSRPNIDIMARTLSPSQLSTTPWKLA